MPVTIRRIAKESVIADVSITACAVSEKIAELRSAVSQAGRPASEQERPDSAASTIGLERLTATSDGLKTSKQDRRSERTSKSRKSGHTKPRPPEFSLDQYGRLRVANMLAILNVSHSTLYAGIHSKRYPAPDGRDGNIPYWLTSTVRRFLNPTEE